VPGSLLTSGGKPGLKAEYFVASDFTGSAAVTRTEEHGYFVWDMHDPQVTPKIAREQFSLRWTGALRVTQAGDYQLGFKRLRCADCKGNDTASLYIDDKLLLSDGAHVSWQPVNKLAPIHLDTGKEYRVRLDYGQNQGAAGLEFVWLPPADAMLREAEETIKATDAAILCVGLNSELEGEESSVKIPGFAGGDRTTIALPEVQEQLLQTAYATGKPVIIVLVNGSALAVASAKEKAAAILEAWYPGQDGGTAIAKTLSGANNPAGRLPVTFYASTDQLPPFTDYSMQGRTYRYFKGTPLYAFGFGLSYSTFEYSDVALSGARITGRVKNASSRAGDDVVSLYTTPKQSKTGIIRQLSGFERVHLEPGETKSFAFTLAEDPSTLSSITLGGPKPLVIR
jgi:beta-glucosidase